MTYVGVPQEEPLENRTGASLSDRQLRAIMSSHHLSNTTREARTSEPYRPMFSRQLLPLSSLAANGARPTNTFTLPQAPIEALPMDRVTDTIRLIQQNREQRAAERQQQFVPATADPMVPPPPAPFAPAGDADITPIFYDGDEDTCSICTERFRSGERVCRLRCRHMFHGQCWTNLVTSASISNNPGSGCCPNCRGAGTLIASWNYVDHSVLTQRLPDGSEVPNALTANAVMHDIATPRRSPSGTPEVLSYPTTPQRSAASGGTTGFFGGSREAEPNGAGSYAFNLGGSREAEAQGTGSTYASWASASPERENFPNMYHVQTRLTDGRPALVIDPGSVGNLSGDAWARDVARAAKRHGYNPEYQRRPRPLQVSGVGQGSQSCQYDCKLPVALRKLDGQAVSIGKITTPTVSNSELPGLLGLTALRRNRAVLDFEKMQLFFLGPGDYNLPQALPPGTDGFGLEVAPSGHLVLPCCEYTDSTSYDQHSLTLMSREFVNEATRAVQEAATMHWERGGDPNVPFTASYGGASSSSAGPTSRPVQITVDHPGAPGRASHTSSRSRSRPRTAPPVAPPTDPPQLDGLVPPVEPQAPPGLERVLEEPRGGSRSNQ